MVRLRFPLLVTAALVAACSGGREPAPPRAGEGAAPHRGFAGRLLALHNAERAQAGAPPLSWDESLAAAAASYGPRLARLGRLAHSPQSTRAGQGENLWMGTHGAYRLDEMVGSWAGERRLFRPGAFPDVSASGNWRDVAHYTQMVWRGTTRLGCAVHETREWDYLICRYSPPGNVVGQRVP